ncbi:MAG TPA: hypothetical protein PKA41_17270, partial [Verrucomicrobiota bacterium]|nr:hypothetical protein [Verrucomicrobiota bacterium]
MIAADIIRASLTVLGSLLFVSLVSVATAEPLEFRRDVQPIIKEYCYDCHGDGMDRGGVDFDGFDPGSVSDSDRDLWWRVLKNVRAGMMPPPKKPQPTTADKQR